MSVAKVSSWRLVMKKIDAGVVIGIACLLYWLVDVFHSFFIYQNPYWVLWFSSLGLGLISYALLTRNKILLNVLFCVMFFIESAWLLGVLSWLVFDRSMFGIADYAFSPGFTAKDFFVTMYHVLIAPALLFGILREKTVYTFAWIGGVIYVVFLGLLTYFFVPTDQKVNCIHSLEYCGSLVAFLEPFSTPYRMMGGLSIFIAFILLPSNFLLNQFGKKKQFTIHTLDRRDIATLLPQNFLFQKNISDK